MTLNEQSVRRLIIYFFYDRDGIVDRYVTYMLKALRPCAAEIFVVCNGKLTPEGRDTFYEHADGVMVRENKGFDVWAYKAALENYGWEALKEYDEIVLMNSTIMGPVGSLTDMFTEMDTRDVDFWGITRYHRENFDPFGNIEYGYIPEHIQSHFIAVRRSISATPEFRKFWETRPEIKNYDDAVGMHEAIFTQHFADMGFRQDVYCDTSDLEHFTDHPIIKMPVLMLEKYHCPIFKRRSFFHQYYNLLESSAADQGKELMEYLREKTNYDTSMIWENILRTCNMADIKNTLHLNYVLPRDVLTETPPARKLALVMHLYYEDLFESCYQYALSMPEDSDILITTTTDEKAEAARKVFSRGPWKSVRVWNIGNRGRDVGALLVGVAPYMADYDYVCFVHDKKVPQLSEGIKGYAFSERCYRNLLGSRNLVLNTISLFEREPFMGLLFPPPPNHSDYYPTLAAEWGPNFDCTKNLLDEMEVNVPIDREKEPVAPLGTMFWFRPVALKKLLDHGWKYEDFPPEPNRTDGTLLHAIERAYPFFAQEAGYYSAWGISDDYARTEWTNLAYMLRTLNIKVFDQLGYGTHYTTLNAYARYNDRLKKALAKLDYTCPGSLLNELEYCLAEFKQMKDTLAEAQVDPQELITAPVCRRLRMTIWLKNHLPGPVWQLFRKIYHFFGGGR